ncbi:DUF5615 family PIN-like protein [Phenylobacterium sp.]|uniref:DUF5615 family PIN-like protein n=1 Tax=Phenylobacterium sp. TaxID=1871053 RepID=UPI0038620760
MRFLVDESCSRAIADALAGAGHDLLVTSATMPGASDRELADLAVDQDRIVVSENFDFGELAVRDRVPIPGVILLQVASPRMAERVARLLAALDNLGDGTRDYLTIVEQSRIRRRRLR